MMKKIIGGLFKSPTVGDTVKKVSSNKLTGNRNKLILIALALILLAFGLLDKEVFETILGKFF